MVAPLSSGVSGAETFGSDPTGLLVVDPARGENVARYAGGGLLDLLGEGTGGVVTDAALWEDDELFAARQVEPALARFGTGEVGIDESGALSELAARLRAANASDAATGTLPDVAEASALDEPPVWLDTTVEVSEKRDAETAPVAVSGVYSLKGRELSTPVEAPGTIITTTRVAELAESEALEARIVEANKDEPARSSKLLGLLAGGVRVAKKVKMGITHRVTTVFAARNESSHRLGLRSTAVLGSAAILVGVLGYVASPETTAVQDKTEQGSNADEAKQLELLRSHLPKVETTPSGAWVPPSIKVWEKPVSEILHSPALAPYNLLVDERLVLATMIPSSLGDPSAKGHNGRVGLMQIPEDVGKANYKKDYDPANATDSLVAGILDLDYRLKIALSTHDYSKDRAGLIRAIIEGPEAGLGYDPVPDYAKSLADRVVQFDAAWSNQTSPEYDKWVADGEVQKLLNQAINNLLEEGLLVRKKQNG